MKTSHSGGQLCFIPLLLFYNKVANYATRSAWSNHPTKKSLGSIEAHLEKLDLYTGLYTGIQVLLDLLHLYTGLYTGLYGN